ncbi:MAG TPA: hypothetical protein VK327_11780 [Candidatus Paceibacterota bacterium]|nr:hypothetical protein [Candidatus Paceibacterota bacterium]
MKRIFLQRRWLILLLLAFATVVINGCASLEPDNASARPWNSPTGWETGGLPSSMNEGR